MNNFTCVREPEQHHWAVELADKVDLAAQIYLTVVTVVWANCREYLENNHRWLLKKIEKTER